MHWWQKILTAPALLSISIVRTRHKPSKSAGSLLPSRNPHLLKRHHPWKEPHSSAFPRTHNFPKVYTGGSKAKHCQMKLVLCIYLPIQPTQPQCWVRKGHGSPGHCQQLLTAARWHLWHWHFIPALCRAASQLQIHCPHSGSHHIKVLPWGTRDSTPCAAGQGSSPPQPPALGESAPHTAPGDRSCTFCQPSSSPGAQPAQHRKHLTLHPTTRSDFLTSHKENQSWYLQPLLLQVSDSAQVSNTVEKNQQDEGVFALV